jgi:hypothetical protein
VKDGDTLRFEPAPAASRKELEEMVEYVDVRGALAIAGMARGTTGT